ncbi:MAG: esterase [Limnochordales bacterium]|nr:esterase [Limnochordales bacterium]
MVTYPFTSRALARNPLGDPAERLVTLLLPPDYDSSRAYPQVWMLPAFGATGRSFLNFSPGREDLVERVTRLRAAGQIGDMVFVLPDTYTSLGGNQHIDSEGVGAYATYLWDELLPFVQARHPASALAVAGKSSGGYGALVSAMHRPGLFAAVLCHSGDMAFELCYLPDIGHLLREVARAGGVAAFREALLSGRTRRPGPSLRAAQNLFAMAATYSPNPAAEGGVDLPVDLYTGEIRHQVWERWLAHDPLRMVARSSAAEALRSLKLLFFDCGEWDEFNLLYGARQFARRLEALGIPHLFETYPDGHMDTGYRWDRSLTLLWQALRPEGQE